MSYTQELSGGYMQETVIIGLHRLGSSSVQFEELVHYYQKNGIFLRSFDLLGFGHTTSTSRGDIESFMEYIHELSFVLEEIRIKKPDCRVILLGENLGGLIALLYALEKPQAIDGLILVNPILNIKKAFNPLQIASIYLKNFFSPSKPIKLPFQFSDFCDSPSINESEQNRLFSVRSVTARFYWAMFKALVEINAQAGKLELPILLQISRQNAYSDPAFSRQFFTRLRSKNRHLEEFDSPDSLLLSTVKEKVFEKQLHFIRNLENYQSL